MTQYLIMVCLIAYIPVSGQPDISQIHEDINQQVWLPFQKGFEALDAAAINETYADKVLRVTPNGIDTESLFKSKNIERFDESKANGVQIDLDFWFESRKTNASTSYEVGIYRIASTSRTGKTTFVYGQFHIVLKQILGHWKITQDWDTGTVLGRAISATDFDLQSPQDFEAKK